jgi:CPA2 family monovalent cation:H+ antiporter-2
VATGLGCLVARELGWNWSAGLVFGMAISVASTVVLLRVLADNHDLHTPAGYIAVGWLVIEDLFTVLVLRYPLRVALSVAVALAQIGEFSFI